MASFSQTLSATGAGASVDAGSAQSQWNYVPTAVSDSAQIALELSPDNATWTRIGQTTGKKPTTINAPPVVARYARANVISLGGAASASLVLTSQP